MKMSKSTGSLCQNGAHPEFRMLALGDDEVTSQFFGIIEFIDVDGRLRTVRIPRDKLHNDAVLRKELINAGALLSESDAVNRKAFRKFNRSIPRAERQTFAGSIGWRDNSLCGYLMGDGLVGSDSSAAKIKPPASSALKNCRRRGNFSAWKEHVAGPAGKSSRLVFGICAALAAPLLRPAGVPSSGYLLCGKSKIGKSTVLVVSGSVMGLGREEDLPNFTRTDAAFDDLRPVFDDSLIPINELGLLKGSKSERNRRGTEFAYQIGEGCGTTYSKYAQTTMNVRSYSRRCIIIGSSEESWDDIARSVGDIRKGGAVIRWSDLPAAHDNSPDIFDLCPKDIPQASRPHWFNEQCKLLRKHSIRNCGVALERFVMHVRESRTSIRSNTRQLTKTFVNLAASGETDPAVLHLASSYGLIYAAGVIGIDADVLPWSEGLVLKSIKRCFRDARKAIRSDSDLVTSALDRFHQKLKNGALVPRGAKGTAKADIKSADGYIEHRSKYYHVVVRGDAFKKWFDDTRQPALLLRWLHSQGALRRKPPPSGRSSVVWAETRTNWPGRDRPRAIVLKVPASFIKRDAWPTKT
jgi:putative DNA primase/helicase